jgi:hypothetical protein
LLVRLQVVPHEFLVTAPHARSPSHQAAFGTAADPAHRAHVEALYAAFQQELRDQGLQVPASVSRFINCIH